MATAHIYKENTFATATQDLSDGGSVTVQRDAYVLVTNGAGFNLHPSVWTVQIDGMIQSQQGGIAFNSDLSGNPAKSSRLTIGTEGTIQVTDPTAAGITLGVPVDVTNSGVIDGGAFGISAFIPGATLAKGFTITNRASGEITGDIAIANNTGPMLTVLNQGLIQGGANAIEWGGAAVITNSGLINGQLHAAATATASTITNSGRISSEVELSNGADKVSNTGEIDAGIFFLDGKNSLTNSGAIGGSVRFGIDDDTAFNSGSIDNSIDLGAGKNSLTNRGTVGDSVDAGTGDDTFLNSGSIHSSVNLGAGKNNMTNSGTIDGSVTFGIGNDTFTNTKSILGHVTLGDGNNTMTNSGTIAGFIEGGVGNDVFRNTGKIDDQIDLGDGDDKFTGGNQVEIVIDNFGNDTYLLGGGDDLVLAFGSGNDSFDGGAGRDLFEASQLNTGILINMGTVALTLNGQQLNATSAFSDGEGGSFKGFEIINGTSFADIIVGSSFAEEIQGGGGFDVIAGGRGADTLGGNAGSDVYLYFLSLDSGVTRATRDTITDFGNGDQIDLSRIDANTKVTTDQAFSWIGGNTPFNHVAGELRAVTEGTDTVIQGDTNGDGKADFSIAVIGTRTFTTADFIL